MTLSELAELVCSICGQGDEESLKQARRFLQGRFRMIWDGALWRDTLCLATAQVAPGGRWVLLPHSTERVLKLRAGGRTSLAPLEGAAVFDYSPHLFEEAGEPVGFTIFAPVVHGPAAGGADALVLTLTSGLTAAQDRGKRAHIELERVDGTRIAESLISAGSGFPVTSKGSFIVRFGKEPTAGAYQVGFLDGAGLSLPIPPGETQAGRRPRLRLLGHGPQATEVLALCKRSCPGWTHDFEHPALPGLENGLLAFATADMLERQRQYAKAQAKRQEGQGLLRELQDLERNQTANECRIIPAAEGNTLAWA